MNKGEKIMELKIQEQLKKILKNGYGMRIYFFKKTEWLIQILNIKNEIIYGSGVITMDTKEDEEKIKTALCDAISNICANTNPNLICVNNWGNNYIHFSYSAKPVPKFVCEVVQNGVTIIHIDDDTLKGLFARLKLAKEGATEKD
jgi:hypothetical protein